MGSAPSVTTLYCAEDDGFITFVSDRFGFRNEDEQWNNTAHDILILGDSFAESACIPTAFQTNFAQNLKVVSLGKGGNGPLTSLAAFIEYKNRFKAEKVYFLITSNDYSGWVSSPLTIDLERELLEPELRKYLGESDIIQDYFNDQYLKSYKTFAVEYTKSLGNNLNSTPSSPFLRTVSKLFFYEFVRSIINNSNVLIGNVQEIRFIDRSELEKTYRKAIYTANKMSSKLIFVPLPDNYSLCKQDVKKLFIDDLLAGLNANVLDVWSELCDKKYFAFNGGHFNKLGYKVLADLIEADFLKN